MLTLVGFAIVLLFLAFVVVPALVVIVPPGSAYVVERLGRYRGTLDPGFNMIVPLVDRVAHRHSLAQQTEELSELCTTKDQKRILVAASFRFRVLDSQRAAYGSADYRQFIRENVRMLQNRSVGSVDWDFLRENSRWLESEVLKDLGAPAETVGVAVLEYEVRSLEESV